jgi:hypothetical protein
MLKRLGISMAVGLARDSLTLVRFSRWRGQPATVLAEHALADGDGKDPVRLGSAFAALFEGVDCAHLPLTVVLADELVRLWQVTPPQGASRAVDIEAACALRFQTLYGESMADWVMSAQLNAIAPFFAAAIPRALHQVLCEQARQLHMTIVDMAPQLIKAFNHHRRALEPDAWFAQVQGSLLTLAAHDGEELLAVRSMAVPANAGLEWLRAQIAREALRLNLPAPKAVQGCGQLPAAWLQADDDGFACSRLDQARRGMPAQSGGAMLALAGARA